MIKYEQADGAVTLAIGAHFSQPEAKWIGAPYAEDGLLITKYKGNFEIEIGGRYESHARGLSDEERLALIAFLQQ
jgi:hypothetical protein